MYSCLGRPSIAPERLLKALLLQILYSVRSERACVTQATGTCEREAAAEMLRQSTGGSGATVGGDKAYDTKGFVKECRRLRVTPHVAQKQDSAIDGRTTCHDGYKVITHTQPASTRCESAFS